MASDSCRPRLYVYRLPDAYRNRLFPERARDIGEPIFRDAAAWPDFPDVQLYNSAMYGLGDLFHSRALAYRCRTFDAAQADLFFVPAYTQESTLRRSAPRRPARCCAACRPCASATSARSSAAAAPTTSS